MRRLAPFGTFVAGATAGGLLVGSAEALYRGVELYFGALLYGALWTLAAAGLAVVAATVTRRQPSFAQGLGAALSLSALVLVRFVVLRDFLGEAVQGRWRATAAGAGAALLCAGAAWLAGGALRRFRPLERTGRAWLLPIVALASFGIVALNGDDDAPLAPAARAMSGRGVILVVADTLRADALGAYGAPPHRAAAATPELDAFAEEGLLFADASAQASWTKPAVSTLLTSRHAKGHGTMSKSAVLPESLPTIASELASAGVRTAAVVTNYNLESAFGFGRGFDEYHYLAPARYLGAPPLANRLAAYNVYRVLREKLLTGAREPRHFYRGGDWVNAVGLQALDRLGDGDFFLWLHYMEPHDPYFSSDGASYARVSHPSPPADWAAPMRDAYRDGVRRFDAHFGALLAALEARALRERTTIVVVSDHGEEFLEHGGWWHGVTLYEEQLHVPLIIGGPNVAGGVDTRLARQIDVAPTILARFGRTAPASWEGRDLLGATQPAAATLAEEDHEGNVLAAVREADSALKLITANQGNPRGLAPAELYDLTRDPSERSPIDAEDSAGRLRAALERLVAQAAKGGATAGTRKLGAEAEAELRALGYVQ